ncbi:MAG: isocitrate/isopropylmalate dehydrogenase family protein [Candidatus Thorarchaeota archaeon]|nr:MAG: isocitrate/isopropylmalate dehydrogenase family protein [Candidatus Thorarchaeota archaeon]
MVRKYKIAVLPGDGIGKEVVPQAVEVLDATEKAVNGLRFEKHEFECGGEHYLRTGREWSEESENFVKNEADAILLGAVGAVANNGEQVRLPDGNMAGYSIVIGLRMALDLYANVRPVRLYEGVPTPLADKGSKDIDMLIVRENTEGLYAPIRGYLSRGESKELAVDVRIITKKGSERIARFAFRQAMMRDGAPVDKVRRVTCVDKSNLLSGCQLFRQVFDEVSAEFPQVQRDYSYVDAWTQWCLRRPEYYDVVVAPNEFGDIITDLGAAVQGGLGVAPAGNIGEKHGMFEPVHGSSPKHYGRNEANPIASILSAGMMLDWLGATHRDRNCTEGGRLIRDAVATVLRDAKTRTYDLCVGKYAKVTPSSTQAVAAAVADAVGKQAAKG